MEIFKRKSGGFIVESSKIEELIQLGCTRIFEHNNSGVHSFTFGFSGIVKAIPAGTKVSKPWFINKFVVEIPQCKWATITQELKSKQEMLWKIAWEDGRY